MDTNSPSPWYKVPTAWLVFAIPATAVLSGIAMITIAVTNRDSLVVDDYYKQGLGINQTLKRQDEAIRLGLTGSLELNAEVNSILVSIRGNNKFNTPPALTLGLYHSTKAASDQKLNMKQVTPGVYTTGLPILPDGRWNIILEKDQWRLSGSMFTPSRSVRTELKPG